jgi:membrane fusion protein (multidrug efflux system)
MGLTARLSCGNKNGRISGESMTMEEKPAPKEPGSPARPAPVEKPATPPPAPPPSRRRSSKIKLFAGVALLIVVVGVVLYYFHFIAPFEDTDDAFIEGHVILLSPRVSGLVTNLTVQDNQSVKAGDTLVEIDPADYETALAQARADLATAQGELEQATALIAVDEAKAEQQTAAVLAAEAEAERATADLTRFETVESRAISGSQLDLARAQAHTTTADVEVARSQAKAAVAQAELSRVSEAAAQARVQQAQAKLNQAELNLSYTKVAAPISGRVTQRTVEAGNYVSTGQALLALVPNDVWVVANFKENQLSRMRPNQPVTISIDAYGGRKFRGHVDSIQAGTGARFGLLPPENAVGNYVKVVQRVPVKILFDEPLDSELVIAPGMSVTPKVRVE